MKHLLLFGLCACVGLRVAHADPLNLFTNVAYSSDGNSPPPADALAVYDSTLDVTGVAGMPTEIAVRIPRNGGDLVATVRLEHMDRREGFGERDGYACGQGNASACEILPYPGFPTNLFSYTWTGQGEGL